MAKQKTNAITKLLVTHQKPIMITFGAIAAIYLVKKFGGNFNNPFLEQHEKILDTVKINPKKTTITTQQAKQFAQQLLDAFNHSSPFYGTDEKAIKQVFEKIKTTEDFKLIYNVFGHKNYNGYNSPPTGILRHIDNFEPRDLVYWLKSELSPSDGQVYKIVKNTVQKAGWTF